MSYVYTGPGWNCSKLGSDWLLFTQECSGTGSEHYKMDPKLYWICRKACPVWIHSGPVLELSCINRRPIWSSFWTRSIWNWFREVESQTFLTKNISNFVPSFHNFKINEENLIKIRREGGRTSNLETVLTINTVIFSFHFMST